MSMSLDGFVGSDREHPGVAIADAEVKRWKLERISSAGAHLMGRTTYEEMSSYWPESTDAYAAPMNDIPKVVFSKTLREAAWRETRIASGDLVRERCRLGTEAALVEGTDHFAGYLNVLLRHRPRSISVLT